MPVENNVPFIVEETGDFAVVYKPPKMHSVPIGRGKDDTLLEWYSSHSPPAFDLVHRLDFETHGLVLAAKTLQSYKFFNDLQDRGEFVKEYSAICSSVPDISDFFSGFPPPPVHAYQGLSHGKPQAIESFFRPFGPGRKQVRPVIDDGKKHKEIAKDGGSCYRTEIIDINGNTFTVRIRRGFRHQIRCHLCWYGSPIMNDPLYGTAPAGDVSGILALRAHALFFTGPCGRRFEYSIKSLLEKANI